jgi:hypothetical protein
MPAIAHSRWSGDTGRMSPANPAAAADRRADARILILIAAMAAVSLVVTALTRLSEASRRGGGEGSVEIWLLEGTSHVVIVALAALFPLLLDRVEVRWDRLVRAAPVVIAAWLGFTLLHVSAMHLLRAILFPPIAGQPYVFRALDPATLGYEGLKDLFVFLLIGSGFVLGRMIEQARVEQQARFGTARNEQKITLRVGAAVHLVPAREIVWVKAAANYAEVHTGARSIFVRTTLASLEQELKAAGGRHVRTHRSYIVNLDSIVSITPTGEGAVVVKLATGEELPGSRGYREALEAAASMPS